jgi:acyl-CoA synthetase (AMP-forming)/AMP-acid ligase II/acyl carrier protein
MHARVRPLIITDLLKPLHTERPDAVPHSLIFTTNGVDSSSALTKAELLQKAAAAACHLSQHAEPGERALICLPTGPDFFIAFFGCLFAGIVAVPVQAARTAPALARADTIARECGATVFITSGKILERIRALDAGFLRRTGMQAVCAEDIASAPERVEKAFEYPANGGLAYLQFTSGSTGVPRGVMVSHANAALNLDIVDMKAGRPRDATVVSWLPLYHDMGLISALYALYAGHRLVLMSPAHFAQQPWRWLKAVSHYRAVYSGGPNFAYELCNRMEIPAGEPLDLSCWQFAFCGAEMVRPATLRRFAERFEGFGFPRRALSPAYGLAESTLIVSGVAHVEEANVRTLSSSSLGGGPVMGAEPDTPAIEISECGTPGPRHTIRIVDPETGCALPEGCVGEIWLAGASKALGYWNRPEESRAVFEARLPGHDGSYLRTGDLGFMEGGRLYVTGRMKELVIVRGRNYHPHELEDAVRNAHAVLSSTVVAFSVTTDVNEELIVIAELRRSGLHTSLSDVPMAVQDELVRRLDLKADFIGLLKPGAVPRTTSGKIQRLQCRENYQAGSFEFVATWPAGETGTAAQQTATRDDHSKPTRLMIENWLVQWLSFRLQIPVENIDRRQPLSAYGMDSLAAVQLSQALEDWLEQPIAETLAWSYPTIEQLGEHVERVTQERSQEVENTSAPHGPGVHSQVDLALQSVERLSEGEVEQMFQRRLVKE